MPIRHEPDAQQLPHKEGEAREEWRQQAAVWLTVWVSHSLIIAAVILTSVHNLLLALRTLLDPVVVELAHAFLAFDRAEDSSSSTAPGSSSVASSDRLGGLGRSWAGRRTSFGGSHGRVWMWVEVRRSPSSELWNLDKSSERVPSNQHVFVFG
jgi:hypothetical protein